jgi:hypothetical protein
MASRYQVISIIKNDTGIPSESGNSMYAPTYYPDIVAKVDDDYIITGTEDRLDLIAYDFYGDSTLWWIVAMANNLEGDSMYPPAGIYLRMPKNISELINSYNSYNRTNI